MTKKEKKQLCEIIDTEGFDYTFNSYSWFPEIKDEKFHKLREDFIKATKELKEYVGYDEY